MSSGAVGEVVLFVGPTLGVDEAEEAFAAAFDCKLQILPPVSQGDIVSLASRRPLAVGIVDGYFDRVPAVWHKEILWIMAQGTHVFGAASMGALRAAELAAFGMRGVGAIFEAYAEGLLEDDDEVTVTHAGADDDFRPASVAMVDVRATLQAALDADLLAVEAVQGLAELAKDLFYPLRTYEELLSRARERPDLAAAAEALAPWLADGRVEQKRTDALLMVRQMAEFMATDPEPMEVRFSFNATTSWQDLERAVREQRPLDRAPGAETLPEGAVLDELRLLGRPYLEAKAEAEKGVLALEVAELHRLAPSPGQNLLDDMRRRLDLADAAAWQGWLAEQGTTAGGLRRLLQDALRIEQVKIYAADHLAPRMLDDLRVGGELADLRRRARQKEEALARHGYSRVELGDGEGSVGPDDATLWHWYFEVQLGEERPDDLNAYAKAHDFVDRAEFRWTVMREYLWHELDAAAASRGAEATNR